MWHVWKQPVVLEGQLSSPYCKMVWEGKHSLWELIPALLRWTGNVMGCRALRLTAKPCSTRERKSFKKWDAGAKAIMSKPDFPKGLGSQRFTRAAIYQYFQGPGDFLSMRVMFDIFILLFFFLSLIYHKAMRLCFPRSAEKVTQLCWSCLLPVQSLAAPFLQEAQSPHLCFYATQGRGSQPCSPPGEVLSVSNKLILDNNEIYKEQKIFFAVYHKLVYKVNRGRSVIWAI